MTPIWLLAAAWLASAAISAMPAPKPSSPRWYGYFFHAAHIVGADLSHWLAGRDR